MKYLFYNMQYISINRFLLFSSCVIQVSNHYKVIFYPVIPLESLRQNSVDSVKIRQNSWTKTRSEAPCYTTHIETKKRKYFIRVTYGTIGGTAFSGIWVWYPKRACHKNVNVQFRRKLSKVRITAYSKFPMIPYSFLSLLKSIHFLAFYNPAPVRLKMRKVGLLTGKITYI